MRVRCRYREPLTASSLGSDTIRQAYCSRRSVVMARPQQPRPESCSGIERVWVGEAELGEVERSVLLGHTNDAHEVIHDLGDS